MKTQVTYHGLKTVEIQLKLCTTIYLSELPDFIYTFLERLKIRLNTLKLNVKKLNNEGREAYYIITDTFNNSIFCFVLDYDNGACEDYVYTCLKLSYNTTIDNKTRKTIRTTILSFIDTCREHDKEIETYTTIVKTVKTGGKIYTK